MTKKLLMGNEMCIRDRPEGLVADGRIVSHDAMADFIKSVVRSIGGVSKDVAFVAVSYTHLPDSEEATRIKVNVYQSGGYAYYEEGR